MWNGSAVATRVSFFLLIAFFGQVGEARAWHFSNENAYRVDLSTANGIAQKSGASAQIQGSLTGTKASNGSTISGKDLARLIRDDQLEVHAYFPDFTQEVTADVKLAATAQNVAISYQTPIIQGDSLSTMIVQIKHSSAETDELQRVDAKIDFKIWSLRLWIETLEKAHANSKTIQGLRDVLAQWVAFDQDLESKIKASSQVVAEMRLPLQVDNQLAQPSFKSYIANHFLFSISYDLGSAIQGDSTSVTGAIAWADCESHHSPLLDPQYTAGFLWNGKLVQTITPKTIEAGKPVQFTYVTGPLSPSLSNTFSESLDTKTYKGKTVVKQAHLGSLGLIEPVASDTIGPVWLAGATPDAAHSDVQTLQPVLTTIQDSFGRVDSNSIKVVLSGTEVSGRAVNQDVTKALSLASSNGGATLTLSGDLNPLNDGIYTLTFTAQDLAGNAAPPYVYQGRVDHTAPQIDLLVQDHQHLTTAQWSVPVSVYDQSPVKTKIVWNGATVLETQETNFTVPLTLVLGTNHFEAYSTDAAGNSTGPVQLTDIVLDPTPVPSPSPSMEPSPSPSPTVPLPPNPGSVAPPITNGSSGSISDSYQFLYSGNNPIQTGVHAGTIQVDRAALTRGLVLGSDSKPLPGVRITIKDHAELGQTLSRADGQFDMVVNGGGQLTFNYDATGYMPVQRSVTANWNDTVVLPDVVMLVADQKVTQVSMNAPTMQVHQANPVTDKDGTRTATLLFPAGTQAQIVLPDGSRQNAANLSVRATEYTVGDNGPKAMPGSLPPYSAYTYAVELSADEALMMGAKTVEFNQPIPLYVDNFLNFPTGAILPLGYYDRDKAAWLPLNNGLVIQIVGIDANGLAQIAVDSTGVPVGATVLSALGITDDERLKLVQLYPVGKTIQRVQVTHFSGYDVNQGTGSVSVPDIIAALFGLPLNNSCTKDGSRIECQNQILGESIPIPGTNYSLNYSSDRANGPVTLDIPVTNSHPQPPAMGGGSSCTTDSSGRLVCAVPPPPPVLVSEVLQITIAGRRFEEAFDANPNQTAHVVWDRKDAYGRVVTGSVKAHVQIAYMYDQEYAVRTIDTSGGGLNLFGQQRLFGIPYEVYQGQGGYFEGRTQVPGVREYDIIVGSVDSKRQIGLGGWSLSPAHVYDYTSQTVHLGDGTRFVTDNEDASKFIINTFAGIKNDLYSLPIWYDSESNGKSALDVKFFTVGGVAVGPDKSVYIGSDVYIFRVAPDGKVYRFAGNWPNNSGLGDEGPAKDADIAAYNPGGLIVGPDGSVYFTDSSHNRVRKITPDGIIHTVAGNGGFITQASTDGLPATQAVLDNPLQLALGSDGTVYIGSNSTCVRYVAPDGIIRSLLQTCVGVPSDGATTKAGANKGLALDSKGNLYFADSFSVLKKMDASGMVTELNGGYAVTNLDFVQIGVDLWGFLYFSSPMLEVVYRYNPLLSWNDGLTRIAGPVLGSASAGYSGDGDLAGNSRVNAPTAVVPSIDGTIFLTDSGNRVVRKITPPFPRPNQGVNSVASSNGKEVYVFDAYGNIQKTIDGLTGVILNQFGYDGLNHIIQIIDRDGNVTKVERDSDGNPTAIVGPYGHRTTLTLDADGYLETVNTPAGQYTLGYQPQTGLLTTFTDPNGNNHVLSYDDHGRLASDQDPGNGLQTLSRSVNNDDGTLSVTHQTRLGRTTKYTVSYNPESATETRTTINPDGSQDIDAEGSLDGSSLVTLANKTTIYSETAADARYGMQAPIVRNRAVTLPSGLQSNYSETSQYQATGSDFVSTHSSTLNQKTSTSTYDSTTKTLTTTSPMGRTTVTVLDDRGRVVQSTFGNLTPSTFTYDTRGRLSAVTQGTRTFQFGYGMDGQLNSMTDPLSDLTSLFYDGAARLIQQTLPGNRDVYFGYDGNSNVTSITPPGKTAHGFKYTGLDFMQSYSAPALPNTESTTQWNYSADRELTDVSFPGSRNVHFNYDQVTGQLTSMTTPDGDTILSYDATSGQLVGMSTPQGQSLSLTYDGALLKTQQWSGIGINGSVTFAYNPDFNVKTEAVSGGQSINRTYDNDGLLAQAGNLSLARDPQSGFVTASSNGAVSESYGYTSFGEIASHSANQNGSQVYSASYTQDALGRISSQTETVLGVSHTYGYTYDNAQRLSQVIRDGTVVSSYNYDQNGNRTSATVGGVSSSATYDAQDRLVTYGTFSYAYNPQGQPVSKTDTGTGQTTSYNYDVLGNLKFVTLPDGKVISYIVDGSNRRVGKQVNGTLVQGFLYLDDLRIAAELDGSGNVVSQFVYGDKVNVPAYMIKGGVTYQIVSDHLGSPRLVVNATDGSVAQQMDYDEFGNVVADSNAGFQPFGFAGGLYDSETGLTHFGARDYDASVGRWTQKDPILFAGGDTNLYGYALTDPLNNIDLTGMSSVVFNRSAGTIDIYSGSGKFLATFPAANNAQRSSKGPYPSGTFAFNRVQQHSGWDASSNGRYGPNGNFIFNVPGRTDMGIHSGRANSCDAAGRCGYKSATNGCIRTTDLATQFLSNLNQTDPLTSLTVH